MGFSVSVAENRFAKIAGNLERAFTDVVEDVAQDVVRDARATSPDNLGISGAWTVDRSRRRLSRLVKNREWRAVFFEDGTPYIGATPMLRPALERNARNFSARLAKALEDGR